MQDAVDTTVSVQDAVDATVSVNITSRAISGLFDVRQLIDSVKGEAVRSSVG